MCQDFTNDEVTRRNLIAASLAVAATAATASAATAQQVGDADEAMPVTPEEALQHLIEGNARYVANAAINTDHSVGRVARARGATAVRRHSLLL